MLSVPAGCAGSRSQQTLLPSAGFAPTYAGTDGAIAGYWTYPAGASATKTITGFSQPDGATLSTIKT